MSFECKECKENVSNSKMAGLVLGQIAASTLESKGITSKSALMAGFSSGEFGSGVLSGMKVKCPSCNKSNWK